MWSADENKFVDTGYDIIEQNTLSNGRGEEKYFEMFVPVDLHPNELAYVKVIKTESVRD